MGEKLCAEYQKLLIPSVGWKKIQVGRVWLCFAWRKSCKAESKKLNNATAVKRTSSLVQGEEFFFFFLPSFLHLGCKLWDIAKVSKWNVWSSAVSRTIFCSFPMLSEHLSQHLKYQNYLCKRQPIEKVTPLPQYPGSCLGPNLEKYIKGTSVHLLLTWKVKSHGKNSLLVWCSDLLKEETWT